MAGFFKSIFSGGWNTSKNYRHFGMKQIDGRTSFDHFTSLTAKLQMIFTSPAVLKVFALQCDLFSLGQVYVYKDGKVVEDDPFLKLIKRPNPFQQKSQFLWDFMFWKMVGNAHLYVYSKVVDRAAGNKMYWLDPSKIEWPLDLQNKRDKFIFSNANYKEVEDAEITYRYQDGKTIKIAIKNLISIGDISNGLGNWWSSPSKIDALYKIIANSEAALDANNINIRYSGKFMVTARTSDINSLGMSADDKKDIEEKVDNNEPVHAVISAIDIKRFVENAANLKLDDSYLSAYFLIGSMYGIPRDVLEAYVSSTYENQEKARGAHVSYCLQPAGNMLMNSLEEMFGYDDRELIIDWEHLPFMQVFAKDRAEVENKKADTLSKLLDLDIPLEEINAFLDTEFTMATKKPTPQSNFNNGQANQGSDSETEEEQEQETE